MGEAKTRAAAAASVTARSERIETMVELEIKSRGLLCGRDGMGSRERMGLKYNKSERARARAASFAGREMLEEEAEGGGHGGPPLGGPRDSSSLYREDPFPFGDADRRTAPSSPQPIQLRIGRREMKMLAPHPAKSYRPSPEPSSHARGTDTAYCSIGAGLSRARPSLLARLAHTAATPGSTASS